jgi:hypothetical protein
VHDNYERAIVFFLCILQKENNAVERSNKKFTQNTMAAKKRKAAKKTAKKTTKRKATKKKATKKKAAKRKKR